MQFQLLLGVYKSRAQVNFRSFIAIGSNRCRYQHYSSWNCTGHFLFRRKNLWWSEDNAFDTLYSYDVLLRAHLMLQATWACTLRKMETLLRITTEAKVCWEWIFFSTWKFFLRSLDTLLDVEYYMIFFKSPYILKSGK